MDEDLFRRGHRGGNDVFRIVLHYHDRYFSGQKSRLTLRRKINQEYGHRYNPQNLELLGARLVAKTKHGQGTAQLVVDNWRSQRVRIDGSPWEFRRRHRSTFDRENFRVRARDTYGPWQFHLAGNFKVRKVVLRVRSKRGHGRPGRGVKTVRCESWNERYKYCPVRGRLQDVRVFRQLSDDRCTYRLTWNYDRRGIWVEDGCRAVFRVRVN